MTIRVLHYGLGPIGIAIVRQASERKGFQIVGGVDIDPALAGKDLGEVAKLKRKLRVKISNDPDKAIMETKPDVVVLCTSSSLKKIMPQIETVLKYKVPVVSTTEELVYPCGANARLAAKIDEWAKKADVAVVGAGVNPGFVMDALPIALTHACKRVDSIRVERVQDARCRRLPFQQKIGAGLTTKEFWRKVKDGTVRHVGLTESISMIADSFGWILDKISDEIQPKIADEEVSSEFFTVPKGRVCGIIQDGIGYQGSKPLVFLHMEAYLGAPNPYEATLIEGEPSISMRINGGVHGDIATASIALNTIPKIFLAQPGFRTMRDMMLPSFFGGFSGRSSKK